MPLVAGETGGYQALSQIRRSRHVDRFAVQPRATSKFSGEHLVARRIVNHTRDPLPQSLHCERNAKHRIAVRKIRSAIERIDVPLVLAAGFDPRSLFTHHVVSWKLMADPLQNHRLRLSIGHRDQIHVALIFNLHVLPKILHQQAARLTGHRLHRRNQVQRLIGCHATSRLSFSRLARGAEN